MKAKMGSTWQLDALARATCAEYKNLEKKKKKNIVGSFKNEASRLATWQQQGCEKAKKQYQEAMKFEMDFLMSFGAVWD